MTSKRTERDASARPPRKVPRKPKFDPVPKDDEPAEPPLTLRNLRLGIAGRLGRPVRQGEFAKMVGISQTHLSSVENGRQPASEFLLQRIADALLLERALVRLAYRGSRARLDRDDSSGKEETESTRKPRSRK